MYKLLVVDDDFESRTTLCSCFPWDDAGFEVVAQLSNGNEALEYVKKNDVDVILCDIKMPAMSGIELAKQLYSQKSKPVIIFLSGYRDFDYAQKAVAFGVRYYMVKPARYQELVGVFKELKDELDLKDASGSDASMQKNLPKAHINAVENQISVIKSYINKNFQNVTLEDVAKHVYMNPCYLSQFFKHKLGMNFTDYLIEIKMKNAAKLLMDVSLRAYDVSEMVGYTNAKNFARTFKSYYHMTPKEYRSRHFVSGPD